MRLFIPPLGTELVLAEDWTFELFEESRNLTMIQACEGMRMVPRTVVHEGGIRYDWKTKTSRDIIYDLTLPAETILRMDRIYIRKGGEAYDSVSFFIANCPNKKLTTKKNKGTFQGTPRFWAKLADVNRIIVKD